MWESHEDFIAMLAQMWQEGGKAHTMQELNEKVVRLAGSLSEWGVHSFGHVRSELKALNEEGKDEIRHHASWGTFSCGN